MPEQRVPQLLRQAIIRRANGCCEYCLSQASYSPGPFAIEHIVPQSQDGPTMFENLALACPGCNGHKSDKTEERDPLSGDIVPLYHPRKDQWSVHFAWNAYFTRIIGLTPTGRATVEALHLNREELVNLRRALFILGEHPPIISEE